MTVVFGLGNPGSKYEGTRHNAGVETLEKLAASYQRKLVRRCFSSYRTCLVDLPDGNRARLVFPLTYMNDSGRVVPKVVSKGDRVIVICDQMDLPAGRIRLREKGSSAGHNGLKSMMAALPQNFIRLYVGVGRPAEGTSVIDHVLTRCSEEDRRKIGLAQDRAVEELRLILAGEDLQTAAARINSFREE